LTSTYDRTVGGAHEDVTKIDLMRKTLDSLPKKGPTAEKVNLEQKRTGHFGILEDRKY
jgi:hypothetical protein